MKLGKAIIVLVTIFLFGLFALNIIVSQLIGVSLITLSKDAITIATAPSLEEIKELPVEEVNKNVQVVVDAFNEGGAAEEVGLEEGLTGLRVLDGEEIVEELTITADAEGNIINISYEGLPSEIKEDEVLEISEQMFRIIFGGATPESLPELLEKYSEGMGG